jgi:hypothetical protein
LSCLLGKVWEVRLGPALTDLGSMARALHGIPARLPEQPAPYLWGLALIRAAARNHHEVGLTLLETIRATAGARQVRVRAEMALAAFTTPSNGGWIMFGNPRADRLLTLEITGSLRSLSEPASKRKAEELPQCRLLRPGKSEGRSRRGSDPWGIPLQIL